MASQGVGELVRPLRALWDLGVAGGLSDRQLLEQFVTGPSETVEPALQALVERHGPMVLRICRRVLVDPNDADDAFQATFLVLLRRARSVRNRGSIASWLHGVALRIAARAKVEAARRRRIEMRAGPPSVGRQDDAEGRDLAALVHGELDRLPEKYRAPIVLCYLEGLTHERAAHQLGWPIGTVRGRLSRARDLLRERLTRRGITATAALIAVEALKEPLTAAVSAASCAAVIQAVVRAAGTRATTGVTSARAAAWVDAAICGVSLSSWKMTAGLLLLIGTIGIPLGLSIAAIPPFLQEPRAEPNPAPGVREANLRELLLLNGTWTRSVTDTPVVNGVPKQPSTHKLIWSIDHDLITSSGRDGFAEHTYRISIDPDRSPKAINLIWLNKGITYLGIYKIDGGTLTICYASDRRPTDFREAPTQIQAVFHRESQTPAPLAQEHANATGCYWSLKPSDVPQTGMMGDWFGFSGDGVQMSLRKDPQAGTLIVMACLSKYDERHRPLAEYRPVIFDDQEAARCPAARPWLSIRIVVDRRCPFGHVRIPSGFAARTGQEVWHRGGSGRGAPQGRGGCDRAAYREARDAGVELLPRPEVGKPLVFSFTAADGTVVRSEALAGKVVLIVCWATEFEGNSDEMPRLKALYERRHREGFEVIGLNFDRDRASGERYVTARGLPWAQVFVPSDPRTWNLWSKVSGFPRFPGLLLIDRRGILRWDGTNAHERDERINALLDAPRTGK